MVIQRTRKWATDNNILYVLYEKKSPYTIDNLSFLFIRSQDCNTIQFLAHSKEWYSYTSSIIIVQQSEEKLPKDQN